MDFDDIFPNQTAQAMPECARERFTIGAFSILIMVYLLFDCIYTCNSKRKMNSIRGENKTLKSIILKSMERSLLRTMNPQNEDPHED